MPVTFPALASGATVDAAQLNTNFADVLNATRGLTSANLATNAGILSSQLADRFAIVACSFLIVPFTSGADLNAPANFNVPDATVSPGTEVWRMPVVLRSGRAAYLVGATFRAAAEGQIGGADVNAWLTVNGVIIGGGAAPIVASATDVNLRNSNPFDDPERSLSNGDYISVGLGRSNAGGRPTLRGLVLTLYLKLELSA